MKFLHPQYFNLFFILLCLLPFWIYRLWNKEKTRRSLGYGPPLIQVSNLSTLGRDCFRYLLVNLALAALIVALAQPQRIRERGITVPKMMDVVFLLDNSPSMRAADIDPSRMEKAIEVIANFSRKKPPHDRIGLVSFSSASIILSYLTEDPSNILYYLDYLRGRTSVNMGTNIGNALVNGVTLVAKERTVSPNHRNHKAVFILVSDGEDYGAELDNAVREVRKLGIKVHTIGIGSKDGAPIPLQTEEGVVRFLEDHEGNRIMSRFNEHSLFWIAEQTGGKAYRSLSGYELERTFDEIMLRERDIEGFKLVREEEDVHTFFLIASFALIIVAMII